LKESTAKSYRTITITEKDIAKAHRNDSYKCVVAQAIARTFPDSHHIEVDTQTIRFTDGHQRKSYLTPYAVQGYVVAFDAGDRIEPFTFQLRNPVPVRQTKNTPLGRRARREAQRSRRKAKKSGTVDPKVAASEAYAAVRAEHPSTVFVETPPQDAEVRTTPPRVFKLKHRTYGMRVLRINRERRNTDTTAEEGLG
jgi:hypothetical protein